MEDKKVAVLIDAENISPKYADLILAEAGRMGSVICRRAYGDWSGSSLASWKQGITDLSITAVQQFRNATGKNSSDSALIIDAMDLLYGGRYQCFCIASSDSDFTRLAARLREDEIFVVGMGEQKTLPSFRNACNKFLYLDVLQKDEKKKKSKAAGIAPQESDLRTGMDKDAVLRIIGEIIDEQDENGWTFLGAVGNEIGNRIPDFDVRNFGYKKLSEFMDDQEDFQTKSVESDKNPLAKMIYVRRK